MLSYIKGLLKLDYLDENDEKDLEYDINKYTSIIYSSKYADSNSNTEALEKLVKAMTVEDAAQNTPANQEIKESVDTDNLKGTAHENDDSNKQKETPKIYDEKKEAKFVDRLDAHLKLLAILRGEEGEVLPAEPAYQSKRFGKRGGKLFVLNYYDIPRWVFEAIKNNNLNQLRLGEALSTDNYIERFQTLLWLEEAHQNIEMRRYDQQNEMLAKYQETNFLVQVPGLAEGRPSLMRGDKLILSSSRRSTRYEGYIYEVRERDVIIKLHSSLNSTNMDGLRFDISFLHSRTPYRRCHHGVTQLKKFYDLLLDVAFPVALPENHLVTPKMVVEESPSNLRCFMTRLNEYQRQAIVNVLKSVCRPTAHVIFGPPGTGKTVTMVEAVLQVYARSSTFKILVCANSNSSTDLLAKRIQDSKVVPQKELLRVSAYHRMEKLIPPELEDITKEMDSINVKDYSDCRVVVTTCSQAAALNEFDDLFDYVFIDEAGHATEPEALIPICLLKSDGCVVLAGDQHQLGPVVISHVANRSGLGTSLLERLSRRSVYQRQVRNSKMVYDDRYITKLIISYRSDKRVMSINNELFYHNELKFKNTTPKRWLDLFKVENPLIFHCVKGRERREYVNPSWFNPNEAIVVLSYVNRLYNAGATPDQLGIITPYRRQIEKLNILFDSCGLRRCKIATMEEFQGDEREFIIISTVRTREKNLAFDQKFNLGFLFNPKRFNVAISRAKWMVFVVGDREILSRDDCWVKYMQKAYVIDETPEVKKDATST